MAKTETRKKRSPTPRAQAIPTGTSVELSRAEFQASREKLWENMSTETRLQQQRIWREQFIAAALGNSGGTEFMRTLLRVLYQLARREDNQSVNERSRWLIMEAIDQWWRAGSLPAFASESTTYVVGDVVRHAGGVYALDDIAGYGGDPERYGSGWRLLRHFKYDET